MEELEDIPKSCYIYEVIPLTSLSCILICLVNNFLVRKRNRTLFDDVRQFHFAQLNSIILTYITLFATILLTWSSVVLLSKLEDVVSAMRKDPHKHILWNYIVLEVLLKGMDKSKHFGEPIKKSMKTICFALWCVMFAPSICLFNKEVSYLALRRTFFILFASTAVAFFWNVSFQKKLMQRIAFVMFGLFIPLSLTTILFVFIGFPHNIFGLTVLFITLYGGIVFYILLFIISTHVFIDVVRSASQDFLGSVIDLYVCGMHIFGRLMILNVYQIIIIMDDVLEQDSTKWCFYLKNNR